MAYGAILHASDVDERVVTAPDVSRVDELAATVREFLWDTSADERGIAALSELEAVARDAEQRAEELEVLRDKLEAWEEAEESSPSWEQVDSANDRLVKAHDRVVAAEARVTELEGALREIDRMDGRYHDLNTARHRAHTALASVRSSTGGTTVPPAGDSA